MRLLLLPISTRRTLIYCEPPSHLLPGSQQSYLEKAVNRATTLWASWEKAESGWKKTTTQYGNHMLRRIPFEEWGLKSIPSLRDKKKKEYESKPKSEIAAQVKFPALYQALSKESVLSILDRIAHQRKPLHKKRMIWSIVGLPFTAPFALIPIIPNLPFFYLVFRAYSHYRALSGSEHLSFLARNNLLRPVADETLDGLYSAGLLHATRADSRNAPDPTPEQSKTITDVIRKQMDENSSREAGSSSPSSEASSTSEDTQSNSTSEGSSKNPEDGETAPPEVEEIMLLKGWNGKLIAERLGLPGLEVEIERAVEQVEKALQKRERESKTVHDIQPKVPASAMETEERKKNTPPS